MKKNGFTPFRNSKKQTISGKNMRVKFLTGFTLIELMVAVGIFTVLIAILAGFFVSAIQAQQKALASQILIDNISYNLEYISRAIRMAKKDLVGECITEKNNYQLTRGGKGIMFKNYQGDCQEFFWNDIEKRLYESKNGASLLPLTPANLEVISFRLGPDDSWGQAQLLQPRVTFLLEIKEVKIQTTISQRNLNVQQ